MFITVVLTMGELIYLTVHRAIFRPVNDPGILIWWICCIRVGAKIKHKKFRRMNSKKTETEETRQTEEGSKSKSSKKLTPAKENIQITDSLHDS